VKIALRKRDLDPSTRQDVVEGIDDLEVSSCSHSHPRLAALRVVGVFGRAYFTPFSFEFSVIALPAAGAGPAPAFRGSDRDQRRRQFSATTPRMAGAEASKLTSAAHRLLLPLNDPEVVIFNAAKATDRCRRQLISVSVRCSRSPPLNTVAAAAFRERQRARKIPNPTLSRM